MEIAVTFTSYLEYPILEPAGKEVANVANEEIKNAVNKFTEKINKALQGNTVAEDIQKAVWDLLEDLDINIDFPGK